MKKFWLITLLVAAVSCGCVKVQQYKVRVVKEYPHDITSYTQGLFFHGDSLYESTGQYGESTFRTVDLESGDALSRMDFSRKYFIEGSVICVTVSGTCCVLKNEQNATTRHAQMLTVSWKRMNR